MKIAKKILSLVLIACMTVLPLTGCRKSADSSKVLNVYNVGDYIDESLIDEFEKQTGIQVQYSTYDTNEMMYQKVKSGSTKYDIVVPSDYMVAKMRKEGLLEKLDFKNIPNMKNIDKKFLGSEYDPKNEYSVPYMWGTLGLAYNSKYVDEKDLGSWDLLWNSKYKGKILIFDSVRDTMGAALFKLGYSMNTTNPKEINEAKELLVKQKEYALAYVNDEVKDRMVGEDGYIGMIYSGDFHLMQEENPDLKFFNPEEGTNRWVDAMCIPTTCENKKEAEMFINFMLDPEIAKINTEYIGYSTPNKACFDLLDKEITSNKGAYPDDEYLSKCETFTDIGKDIKLYDKAWIELKSR